MLAERCLIAFAAMVASAGPTMVGATCGCRVLTVPPGVTARVLYQGKNMWVPVKTYMVIRFGDVIDVRAEPVPTIICDGMAAPIRMPLNAQPQNIRCPDERGAVISVGGQRVDTGGLAADTEAEIPRVVEPQGTSIATVTPRLRWRAVAGAERYELIVRGPGHTWSRTLDASAPPGTILEDVYPSDAQQLKPGIDYRFVVRTNGQSSADRGGRGQGFSLLTDAEITAFKKQRTDILQLDLPPAAEALLTGSLAAAYHLNADALAMIESYVATEPEMALLAARLHLLTGSSDVARAVLLGALAKENVARFSAGGIAEATEILASIAEENGHADAPAWRAKARAAEAALQSPH
jgi:hypothetical protein